jgi:hypothetical protein
MKYVFVVCLIVSVVGSINDAFAAETTNCTSIENARERLACFDSVYPSSDAMVPLPKIQSEVIGERPMPTENAATGGTEPGIAPEVEKPSARERKTTSKGLLDWIEEVEIESKVAAVRRREAQKMVFRLENGEIWMQSTPRDVDIKVGDDVTIKNGKLGGYIMRTSSGASTRVQRLE